VAGGVQWLPGGQSLIASYRDGNTATPQLWRVEAGSGAATAITRDLFAYADLSAAADGGMFVATASLGESTLWVAAADNVKQPAQITSGAADAEGAGGVDWMPDGSIVYASRASGNLDLWILDPQTGTRRQLTSDPADDQQPSLSPDGRSIAFVSGREGGNRIWVMHADGTEPRAVSPAPGASPFWTPDGRAILFVSSTEVRQVNTDGTAEKLVGGDWPARAGNAGNLFIPRAISRQGLVAGFVPVSDRGGGWQLAVAPIDRSAPPTVLDATFGSANLGDIAWAPDGKAIDAPQPADAWNLWRYPIDGGKGYRLTAMTGPALTRRFAWSPDGRLLLSRGENKSDLVLFRRASGR
jgi:Tol biopolymer transport system component